jgi:hypothetical protein
MQEPDIIVNGARLTPAQSATVRVAIENLSLQLDGTNPIDNAYRERIAEIRRVMYAK